MSVHFKIITPVYNSESYIRNTLISVLGQDYDNFEYIITDDCSTDNTFSIIKNIAKITNLRIKFFPINPLAPVINNFLSFIIY